MLSSASFSMAPLGLFQAPECTTTATQTHVPLLADASTDARLSDLGELTQCNNQPVQTPIRRASSAEGDSGVYDGGVAAEALESAFSPQDSAGQVVQKLQRELDDTKRRADEATHQWAKWVEKCAKHAAVLNSERQIRESIEAEKIALEARLRESQTASRSVLLGRSTAASTEHQPLFTEAEMKHAVRAARDEGMALASDVADFCVKLLDDVKAGKTPL